MAGLSIENLTKSFGKRNAAVLALDHLSIAVFDGELLALLGPSGSGKTTALRLIAGLEKADEGHVTLDDRMLTDSPPQDRNIGMAFQYPALLPQMDIRQNLALGLKLRGVPESRRGERVQRMAELLGITELLHRKPETLSGGQQQRAALARALLPEPRLVLLDEPLANLDPLARQELRQVIRRVLKELNVTAIYVTHDQLEAVDIADRIALLDKGRLQQAGSAHELYAAPQNLFVARFIGPAGCNCIEGTLTEKNGSVFLNPGGGVLLRIEQSEGLPLDRAIAAAFRPDCIQACAGGLECIIEEARDHGWSKTATLRFADHRIHADCRTLGEIRQGTSVSITLASIFAFDPASGQRIASSSLGVGANGHPGRKESAEIFQNG
jgi:multiple sugar transport system ATP-binding protein